ncbi:type II toxin-antitoxin system HicB family antitoxin [Methanoculleus chikugoensis]|uniref:type II toxin-antitoxin system HicB family antitoxin n=1 Tax=Methanoculleus chikugoensis TaxID=118126 RepID=UPI000B22C27D|nr:type II toxin-antitoxin system HicB family antitoxin [Methanoculleus chikugoensis]
MKREACTTVSSSEESRKTGIPSPCRPFRGASPSGETVDEAIAMAREATELYIEHLLEKGEDIPTEEGSWNTPSPLKPMPELPALTALDVIWIL